MRRSFASVLLSLAACLAATEPVPLPTTSVRLRESRQMDASQLAKIESISLRLLASAQFNTMTNAATLKQSVPRIHERYREALAGDYVLLKFAEPATIQTLAGKTRVYDLVIGIGPQYANSVFTVDETGRLIAHEKCAGEIAIELRDAVMSKK